MNRILTIALLLCASCGFESEKALPNATTAQPPVPAYTPNSSLPTSGMGNYTGNASIEGGPFNLQGQIALSFDFSLLEFSGDVSAITDGEVSFSGQLGIHGGNFCRCADPTEQYSFDGLLSGSLGHDDQSMSIDGTIAGNFFGLHGELVSGNIHGVLSHASSDHQLSGEFQATD